MGDPPPWEPRLQPLQPSPTKLLGLFLRIGHGGVVVLESHANSLGKLSLPPGKWMIHLSPYIHVHIRVFWVVSKCDKSSQKKRLDVAWARSVDRTCQNRGSSRRREIWRRCKRCTSASKWIDPTDPEFYEKVCRKQLHLRVVKHVRPHPRGTKITRYHGANDDDDGGGGGDDDDRWWWWWLMMMMMVMMMTDDDDDDDDDGVSLGIKTLTHTHGTLTCNLTYLSTRLFLRVII